MKIIILSFSQYGHRLGKELSEKIGEDRENQVFHGMKSKGLTMYEASYPVIDLNQRDTKTFLKEQIKETNLIIFISACGIAVRLMAPFLQSKKIDPAVLVIDDGGNFCISLVSGHLGGANEWAAKIAPLINALPVITTSTDIHQAFAVDLFAKKNKLLITDLTMAKEISATILQGNVIGCYSDLEIVDRIDEQVVMIEDISTEENSEIVAAEKKAVPYQYGIEITHKISQNPFVHTLHLIPQNIVLGIGCRKGTSLEQIEGAVLGFLQERGVEIRSIAKMGSIDLKTEEKGLLEFSEKFKIPFIVFSKEELEKAEGVFIESSFVKGITGVGNVCERSASLLSHGNVISKKQVVHGITISMGQLRIEIQ